MSSLRKLAYLGYRVKIFATAFYINFVPPLYCDKIILSGAIFAPRELFTLIYIFGKNLERSMMIAMVLHFEAPFGASSSESYASGTN